MSKTLKKIKHTIEKNDIKKRYAREPKKKCPICKQFSLFKREYDKKSRINVIKCVQCNEIIKTEH